MGLERGRGGEGRFLFGAVGSGGCVCSHGRRAGKGTGGWKVTTPKKRGAGYEASRDERQRGPQADTRTKAFHAPISSSSLLQVFGKGCIYVMKKEKLAVSSCQELYNRFWSCMVLPS